MQPVVQANVLASAHFVAEYQPRTPANLIIMENIPQGHAPLNTTTLYARYALKPFPNFYSKGASIAAVQQDYFGFYALRNSGRGLLASIEFLRASSELLRGGYCGPSVVLSYSAAFQLLQAYLALNGVAVFNPSRGLPFVRMERNGSYSAGYSRFAHKAITAVLATEGHWTFAKNERPFSHLHRWMLLARTFAPPAEIPRYFRDVFEYLASYGPFGPRKVTDEQLIRKGVADRSSIS